MIQKPVVSAIAAFLVFAIPCDRLAAGTVSVNDSGGFDDPVVVSVNNPGSFDDHFVSVFPGGSFSIDINVATSTEIIDVLGMTLMASAPDVLAISGGLYCDPWSNYEPLPVGNLDPGSDPFRAAVPAPEYFGPGASTLATFYIVLNADAPTDVFTLNVVDAKCTACWICPAFFFAGSGPDFVVEVVPEPSSVFLLAGGALLLVRRRSAR